MTEISVPLNAQIVYGEIVFSRLNDLIKGDRFSSLFILADENSMNYCMPELVSKVPKLLEAEVIEIESGEASKNIETCTQVWMALSELGADRNSLLINLGGGVITDMGGFIASAFKRGITFVNIPTTLLAQVDASLGGKTGIDLGVLKNEIGFFAEPMQVFIYTGFLNTLDPREYLSGIAEILKHGLVADREYWKRCVEADLQVTSTIEEFIRDSVKIKSGIVLRDPKESGERKKLNFGHTIGHALESLFLERGESSLLHGEAVAIGMLCEAYISVKLCGMSEDCLNEIKENILWYFSFQELNAMDDHRILELMLHDKKNRNGEIRMTLLQDIGDAVFDQKVTADLILESLNFYRSLA
jgi:3-dehydroquinate synthase